MKVPVFPLLSFHFLSCHRVWRADAGGVPVEVGATFGGADAV